MQSKTRAQDQAPASLRKVQVLDRACNLLNELPLSASDMLCLDLAYVYFCTHAQQVLVPRRTCMPMVDATGFTYLNRRTGVSTRAAAAAAAPRLSPKSLRRLAAHQHADAKLQDTAPEALKAREHQAAGTGTTASDAELVSGADDAQDVPSEAEHGQIGVAKPHQTHKAHQPQTEGNAGPAVSGAALGTDQKGAQESGGIAQRTRQRQHDGTEPNLAAHGTAEHSQATDVNVAQRTTQHGTAAQSGDPDAPQQQGNHAGIGQRTRLRQRGGTEHAASGAAPSKAAERSKAAGPASVATGPQPANAVAARFKKRQRQAGEFHPAHFGTIAHLRSGWLGSFVHFKSDVVKCSAVSLLVFHVLMRQRLCACRAHDAAAAEFSSAAV